MPLISKIVIAHFSGDGVSGKLISIICLLFSSPLLSTNASFKDLAATKPVDREGNGLRPGIQDK